MPPRVAATFGLADFVAAEDTRVTLRLLNHLGLKKPMVSYYEHALHHGEAILNRIEAGENCALCSDAGMPCISDPGSILVHEAAQAGIEVLAVPGATAMASALSVSGFDTREFAFYGFLPRQKKDLEEKLLSIAHSGVPIAVAHESPHRVVDLVRVIAATLPGCRISASCDLTKLYEKTIRGTADEVLAMLLANEKAEKGEYCLVLDLHDVHLAEQQAAPNASLEARIFELMFSGKDMREAGDILMAQGEKRNDVYRARTAVQRFLESLYEDEEE